MLAHENTHALGVLEVLRVGQLVQFIRADTAHIRMRGIPCQVLW